jgi:hypothetical protein
MCLVADVPRLLNIRRWRVQPERPFDRVLVNGLLLVGVEEMTAGRATAIVEDNEEFRRMGDGPLVSTEDAVTKLRGQAPRESACSVRRADRRPSGGHRRPSPRRRGKLTPAYSRPDRLGRQRA